MIDLISANEALDGHHLRAWTGVAVDEGVGLLTIVEVSNDRGLLCRFEEFLDASIQHQNANWPLNDTEAAHRLQDRALNRARAAVHANALPTLNGHRYDATA